MKKQLMVGLIGAAAMVATGAQAQGWPTCNSGTINKIDVGYTAAGVTRRITLTCTIAGPGWPTAELNKAITFNIVPSLDSDGVLAAALTRYATGNGPVSYTYYTDPPIPNAWLLSLAFATTP